MQWTSEVVTDCLSVAHCCCRRHLARRCCRATWATCGVCRGVLHSNRSLGPEPLSGTRPRPGLGGMGLAWQSRRRRGRGLCGAPLGGAALVGCAPRDRLGCRAECTRYSRAAIDCATFAANRSVSSLCPPPAPVAVPAAQGATPGCAPQCATLCLWLRLRGDTGPDRLWRAACLGCGRAAARVGGWTALQESLPHGSLRASVAGCEGPRGLVPLLRYHAAQGRGGAPRVVPGRGRGRPAGGFRSASW